MISFCFSVAIEAKNIRIQVNGMVCSFCAQGLIKKFTALPEVTHVDVSLKDKRVVLSLKDGQDIPDNNLKKWLKDAGYTVEKIERE